MSFVITFYICEDIYRVPPLSFFFFLIQTNQIILTFRDK